MASSPITLWQIEGKKVKTVTDFIFLGFKITADGNCSCEVKRHLLLGRKTYKRRQHIKKQRYPFANKSPYDQSYGLLVMYGCDNSYVWMWQLNHKKGWALKNSCFRIVVKEKTLESPLDCKEIKPVYPKGNQS